MQKGDNFDGIHCLVLKPAMWHRVYMMDDVRAFILPNGELTALPRDAFQINSFALSLHSDIIKEELLNQ